MDLARLHAILTAARILPELPRLLAPGEPLFLVGGTLRDWLLGRSIGDFDFATPGDPTTLAQRFAQCIGGHWFLLDEVRRQSRITLRHEGETLTCDFAPFRAADLEGDLRLRDFTFNAMAMPILSTGKLGPLHDPLGGQKDLAERQLRACSAGVFADDPLRVLKGVRHAAVLGFAPEAETFTLMREAAGLLGRIAPERVRAELVAIFAAGQLAEPSRALQELGLWCSIFGPPSGSLAAGENLIVLMEAVLAALRSHAELIPLLSAECETDLSRATLLKLAAFLRGYKPADLPARLAALRFGRKAIAILTSLHALPSAKMEEVARLPDYSRGRALWAAQLGANPVDALLFLPCLGEGLPEIVINRVLPVLHDHCRLAVAGRIPDLLDGGWLRQNLGIEEGRAAGTALAMVRREEIAGRVQNAAQAADFLRSQRQEIEEEND